MFKPTSLVVLGLFSSAVAQLNTLAQAAGKKYFGTATDNPELSNTSYVAQLRNTADFHQLTPANSMKWDATEPSRGIFTFQGGDQIVSLAELNGQLVRGLYQARFFLIKSLGWFTQVTTVSGTINSLTGSPLAALTMQPSCPLLKPIVVLSSVITAEKFVGLPCTLLSWDVINEPFNDDGTFRESVFFSTTGTSYITTALRAARAADSQAKLYINDFNIEGRGPKSTAMAQLVKQLQADRVPIDGIGIQGHLIVGEVPPTFAQNLQDLASLGVEVAITELDIRMTLPATPELLAQQKADYETVIAACKAVDGCVGVTLWDWTDKFSWVPGAFAGEGVACPWDENFVRKPAFQGIVIGWVF
ncbi:unnamed protein product [Cyclocybe aegerita]|uniref:Beta-xylanase n=1 Tax=Cyclocybe aegerita TaxID=1973307 RepID=A0A8S0WZH0_CYCAE|nr:unnamed protein product [Cyclocybe aegerita]